ncbi:DUF3152 domain-containing protein [Streptomyces sp. NPDC051567]|uniref:DUF3152 domain-containing protein n=1 Tax=Streptomyces sp. NPDC051567 TaxID=3365660 RepID=UPI0037A40539
MGRHSRKDPAPARPAPQEPTAPAGAYGAGAHEAGPDEVRPGRRRAEPAVTHQGYAPSARPGRWTREGGHPEQREPGGAWGAGPAPADPAAMRPGRPVPAPAAAAPHRLAVDTDTPAFGTPALGFPQVPQVAQAPVGPQAPAGGDPATSTGSHRRIPGPRKPADAPAEAPAAPPPGERRGLRARTYTGIAAAAVTAVLAVVVAGQVASEGEADSARALSADDGGAAEAHSARSEGHPPPQTPVVPPAAPAPEPTYEQKMARQLPIDPKLAGPGTFDTVPGIAPAPGKGRVVRYRVDVEQDLGMDGQLFAEAVHRTLNDPRSWSHGGARTFTRVPGGEADFVITLASPGTTGVWCAKSGLNTTIDNVSCDSASTDRVMINAFRWAQGSPTYGADQMFAYRQMLINHEVGHRLGHDHVSCATPGALAPIMQQQTKSLDIGGISCKPNPWVYPGS